MTVTRYTFLAKALKKIGQDKFDKMIVFLGWEHGQRTNNHVERNNRVFRMMQKTRDKRRKTHTIEKALELAALCPNVGASVISTQCQSITTPFPREIRSANGGIIGIHHRTLFFY